MRVLVTTDGSERSLRALPHAAAFARATGSQLTLARVLDPLLDLADQPGLSLEAAAKSAMPGWQSAIAAILAKTGVDGDALVIRKARGEDIWETVLRAAEETGASLIAMDSRGAGAIRHALFGSVALDLVAHTELPIMVTGPSIQPPAPRESYRIVATSDGSPASLAVVRALGPLLETGCVDVTLLRLCWPAGPDHSAEDCAAQLKKLRQALPGSERVNEEVRELMLIDGAAPAIISVSEELGASALAVATHGHSAAYHLFGGSTALGIVERSPLPVILCRSIKPV
ncbi:MAG: universal stress protein [Anaerolineaceae bacterium]